MSRDRLNIHAQATEPLSEGAVLGIGLAAGIVLRIVQIATSIGSMDSYFWTKHVELVEKFGVLRVYHAASVINHPPFSLEIALWTARIGRLAGLHVFDSLRILQGIADVITTVALLRIARQLGSPSPASIALVYFLSPAAIFISAFHCNSDPTMVMFIVLAVLAVLNERPVWGGLLIGCAAGIKIIAFPVIPLLLLACRSTRARVQCLAASAAVSAAIFVPALVVAGRDAMHNIFGYTGWPGGWGLPLAMEVVGFAFPKFIALRPARVVTPLLIATMIALWTAEAWRVRREAMNGQRLPQLVSITYLIVLFLAPGFGVPYFLWLLPFLAFLFSTRVTLSLHALISVFVFWLYTSWAGEWPWVYAEGGRNSLAVGIFGLVVWAAIGCALGLGVRNLYRHAGDERVTP